MHTKPCRAGPPIFPLIIISLDDFNHPAIDFQVAFTHYIDFSTFRTRMHLFWLPPLTRGCHHPPYLTGTPLHHLLALCHCHPTLPSPWVTPRSTLACAHTHVRLIGAPSTHFPVDFYQLPVHNGWGAAIIPFCGGPMLHALHVCPIPTTFLLAYTGILFTHS